MVFYYDSSQGRKFFFRPRRVEFRRGSNQDRDADGNQWNQSFSAPAWITRLDAGRAPKKAGKSSRFAINPKLHPG